MGTITSATKSGANQFHGSVFWYVRNSALDARNAFAVAKPFQNLHNYGGTFGGPIQKDKTFFFADFDGMRGVAAYRLHAQRSDRRRCARAISAAFAALKNPFTGVNPFNGNVDSAAVPQPAGARRRRSSSSRCRISAPPNLTAGELSRLVQRTGSRTAPRRSSSTTTSATGHTAFLRYENRKDDYHIPGARSPLPPTTVGTSDNIRRVNFWTLGDVAHAPPEPGQRIPRRRGDPGLGQQRRIERAGADGPDRHSGPARPRPHQQPAVSSASPASPATTSTCSTRSTTAMRSSPTT